MRPRGSLRSFRDQSVRSLCKRDIAGNMFARCIEIARSLLISCIVAQLIWLSGGSTPGNEPIETTETTETTENYHETTISWSDPNPTEPDSRTTLPSNLNLRKHPIWKIHIIYQGVELSPQELWPFPIMEDDGGEKLRDQVNTGDDVSRAGSDDHRERNYVRVAQGEISRATDERNSPAKEETKVDLSFLDNLGGLAPFLPDVKDSETPDTLPNEEASPDYSGFFDWLVSKLRGTYRESTASDGTIVYEGYSSRQGKSDKMKTYLFPKYRDLYAKLSSANLDPRVRLEMLAELNRPNMTFISETPVNHSEVPPPSPDNYHQSAENNHAQKFSRINAANPPIRNAVDFRRPRHN